MMLAMMLAVLCILMNSLLVFGDSSEGQLIECNPGKLNVILAAPHGGSQTPDYIPNRDYGCLINGECVWSHDCGDKDQENCWAITENDVYTMELTKLISTHLENITGKRPTTVFNTLHRSKLDANRDMDQATFGNPEAIKAWTEFHSCINNAKDKIQKDKTVSGMGIFFDIHGHGHPNVWAELGYLIRRQLLDSDQPFWPNDTSIYHLSTKADSSFDDLFRGDNSFGYFLEKEGYESIPSPTNRKPNGVKYFSGGFNTRTHGSLNGGTIDAIQIESARKNREEGERENYASGIAKAIVQYMQMNYPSVKMISSGQESLLPKVTNCVMSCIIILLMQNMLLYL